jgi:hypothetical protein
VRSDDCYAAGPNAAVDAESVWPFASAQRIKVRIPVKPPQWCQLKYLFGLCPSLLTAAGGRGEFGDATRPALHVLSLIQEPVPTERRHESGRSFKYQSWTDWWQRVRVAGMHQQVSGGNARLVALPPNVVVTLA